MTSVFLSTIHYLDRSRKFYESCGFVFQPERTKPLFDGVQPCPDEVIYSIKVASPRFRVDALGSGPFRSLHHSVRLGSSKYGKGLFASEAIEENVLVWKHVQGDWEFAPIHFTFEALKKLSEEEKQFALHFGYQVGDNTWEAPHRSDVDKDASNYMNHSCNPNV